MWFLWDLFGTPLMQIGDFCFLGCIHPQVIDALKFKVHSISRGVPGLMKYKGNP